MIRLAAVLGIRSHFIKAAAIQRYLTSNPSPDLSIEYVNTGQHYDYWLADALISALGLTIDVSLKAAEFDRRPRQILLNSISLLEDYLESLHNCLDGVVVFGDANATLAGALAAARQGVPVIHIEAGLRTGDLRSLEEVNRRVADHVASLHIASSRADLVNLQDEGLSGSAVFCGDLVKDMVHYYLSGELQAGTSVIKPAGVLATVHRHESLDPPVLRRILAGLGAIPRTVTVLAHPRLQQELTERGLRLPPNVILLGPVRYSDLLESIAQSSYVVSDSGALQRESHYLGKRCLVIQASPFWTSLVTEGANISVPPTEEQISWGVGEMERLIEVPIRQVNDFGCFPVASAISEAILQWSSARG